MASGKSLELAKIPRRTHAWLTDVDGGVFGTGRPSHPHTRAELEATRQRAVFEPVARGTRRTLRGLLERFLGQP